MIGSPTLLDAPTRAAGARLTGHYRGVFGESAIWSPADGGIWWVDMHGHALLLSRPDGTTRLWKTPGPELPWARAVVLREGGGLIVALSDTLHRFDPASGVFTPLALAFDIPAGHLFNDATVDPFGRLIIGTMLPGRGNDGRAVILQIDRGGVVRLLVDGLGTTNGLAFSPDGRTFYYSDSQIDVRKVWAASYDPASGRMGAARLFIDFSALPGKPDGAAMDSQGGYWLAAMASPWLHRFSPDGRLLLSLELPLDTPTRPAFGGAGLATLFTSSGGLKSGETDDGMKGGLLQLASPVAGLAAWTCRLC